MKRKSERVGEREKESSAFPLRFLCAFAAPHAISIRVLIASLFALMPLPAFHAQAPSGKSKFIQCAPSSPVVINHWQGEYFNNRDLSGLPTMVRDDGEGALDFDWGLKSPDAGCGVRQDDFSVRWTRVAPFGDGAYRFTIAADDGVRLYIDGKRRLDQWRDQMASHTLDAVMTAGNHEITLEYYEGAGSAAVKLRWERHPCFANVPPDHWRGEYFDNPNLTGQPKMTRDDGEDTLDFDFGLKSPGESCQIPADDFSARWTRTAPMAAGTYRFTVTADDGARLFIDGKKQIDEWRNQAPATFVADVALTAGNHRIVVEYYDHTGGAVAKVDWQLIARAPALRKPR